MQPEALLTQFISGLSNGIILFIIASGLTLIFGVLRVINFAHGALYMLGAYLGVTVANWFSEALITSLEQTDSLTESAEQTILMLAFILALIVVPAIIAIIGYVMERFLFRRIYDKEHLLQLLLTYGLTLIVGDVVRAIWGGDIYRFSMPDALRGRIRLPEADVLGLSLNRIGIFRYNIFLIIVGLLIALCMWYLLQRTRFGRIIRAAVANPEMLSALGINVKFVFMGVFMLGCWLAGLGGVLEMGKATPGLNMGSDVIVQAFAVVVIGGLGSFTGALLGSLLIGIVLAMGILYQLPAQALPFLAMAAVLILRPWGLMGKPER